MPLRASRSASLVTLLTLSFAGCDRLPEQHLATTKAALDSAAAGDAAYYCEAQFTRAQTLFDSAAAVITSQQRIWAPLRQYGRARRLLDSAAALARALVDSLPRAREAYAARTRTMLERATDVVTATEQMAREEGDRGKRTRALQAELADMREILGAAEAAFRAGDHVRARTMATSVIDRAGAYRNLLPQLPTPAVRLTAKARKGK
ncbi:MAG: hypothetical protein GF331_22180 [Chitinivibrionales bacterium]|nr:hypothetical protein [Chitinivibrionales bacterium]